MCVEGRVAALLVALALVAPRVAGGSRLEPVPLSPVSASSSPPGDPARPREGARLPPGEYRVAASRLDAEGVYRPELLRQLSAAGVPLGLGPLDTPVIDLRLTLAAMPQRTSAR